MQVAAGSFSKPAALPGYSYPLRDTVEEFSLRFSSLASTKITNGATLNNFTVGDKPIWSATTPNKNGSSPAIKPVAA